MKTIYKYTLALNDITILDLPAGAEILSLQVQYGLPRLWAVVDPQEPLRAMTFVTYGTGHPLPDQPGKFVGTYQLDDGALVFHVFLCE